MHQHSTVAQFRWDNSYAERLSGFYFFCAPSVVPNPVLLRFNSLLAEELGLNAVKLDSSLAAQIFSGTELPAGAQPLAQAYAGQLQLFICICIRSLFLDRLPTDGHLFFVVKLGNGQDRAIFEHQLIVISILISP